MRETFNHINSNVVLPDDTPEAVATWKNALEHIEGLWEDRESIIEEMNALRKEADRSFFGSIPYDEKQLIHKA